MKLRYLGTAAAEGIPAVFCNCPQCEAARKAGGHEIRTRAGALLDGCLKLDFGPDSYMQMLRDGLRFHPIQPILITHTPEDPFAYTDIAYRVKPYSQLPDDAPPPTVIVERLANASEVCGPGRAPLSQSSLPPAISTRSRAMFRMPLSEPAVNEAALLASKEFVTETDLAARLPIVMFPPSSGR